MIFASCCVVAPAGVARAQASDARYESGSLQHVVSRRTRERELEVTLVVDQRRHATSRMRSGDGLHGPRVALADLDPLLAPALRSETRDALIARAGDDGLLELAELRAHGLQARFERSERKLYVDIPPAIRRVEVISLTRGDVTPNSATQVHPSPLSGFVNLRGVTDYVSDAPLGAHTGRQPAQIELDGAANWQNWVLESRFAFAEGAERRWQRGETRLVRDFPHRSTRFEAGDLSLPIAGFQSRRPMAGLSFGTQFDLQPERVFHPTSTREFVLDRASVVGVYVNGQPTRNLRLLPGRYDVRDFQFSNGVNDVRIRIEDDLGRVREIDFGFAFEPTLLARGKHQFSYSAGLPSFVGDDLASYESERPTFSGFHRYGLGESLTLGANLQTDVDQLVLGMEATWAGTWGSLRTDLAFASGAHRADDYALRARYEYFDQTPANRWRRRIALGVESRGADFAALGATPGESPTALELTGSLRQDLFTSTLHASLDGRHSIGRGGEPDETLVAVTLHKQIANRFQVDLTLERTWSSSSSRPGGLRSLVSVVWTGAPTHHSLRMSHDSADHSTQLDWSYTPVDAAHGLAANARVTRRPLQREVSGNLHYMGPRMEADLRHDATFDAGSIQPSASGAEQQRTTLRLGTALAFAGGRFAVSRPITHSFALVVPEPELNGAALAVGGSSASLAPRVDRLGPAVLPDLVPYRPRDIHIDASLLPPGVRLDEAAFQARPTYKSGLVIPLAADEVSLAQGFLLQADGDPVRMQSGVVRRLDDPEAPARMVFTNRRGFFRCADLAPGTYELRLGSAVEAAVHFTVPPGSFGQLDLGQLWLPRSPVPSFREPAAFASGPTRTQGGELLGDSTLQSVTLADAAYGR